MCPQVVEKNWGGLAAEEGWRVGRLGGMENWEVMRGLRGLRGEGGGEELELGGNGVMGGLKEEEG